MKAFVTGGTGFIGRHLVRKLLERGDDVTVLVRTPQNAAELEAAGARLAQGDITDRASLRPAMQGSDVVYHVAGWYKVGTRDISQAEAINVEGTRNVLETAFELGIPKIVYTSSLAVLGDTTGAELRTVDENYRMPEDQPFVSEYDRTKWRAHYEVALPLIEKGAPVTIVMPGGVYGPGDPSILGDIMRAFYKGLLVFFPGPETILTYAHVDDIAQAHILAAEIGKPGESYITAGPALALGEVVEMWAQASGKRAPLAFIPARWMRPMAPVVNALSSVMPIPPLLSTDAIRISGTSYVGWPAKAHRELGWGTRSPEEGFREFFADLAGQDTPAKVPARGAVRVAGLASLVLLLFWLARRRRQ